MMIDLICRFPQGDLSSLMILEGFQFMWCLFFLPITHLEYVRTISSSNLIDVATSDPRCLYL